LSLAQARKASAAGRMGILFGVIALARDEDLAQDLLAGEIA
jgi:hypothetical protein